MSIKISCNFHPRYRAIRRPTRSCESCKLLYIFRWQITDEAEEHLGGINPYQFVDLSEACESIRGAELEKGSGE